MISGTFCRFLGTHTPLNLNWAGLDIFGQGCVALCLSLTEYIQAGRLWEAGCAANLGSRWAIGILVRSADLLVMLSGNPLSGSPFTNQLRTAVLASWTAVAGVVYSISLRPGP